MHAVKLLVFDGLLVSSKPSLMMHLIKHSFYFKMFLIQIKHNVFQQYVKGISSTGMQSSYGFEGQVSACWKHQMTRTEIELIKSAGFLVSVIHGRCILIVHLRFFYAMLFAGLSVTKYLAMTLYHL